MKGQSYIVEFIIMFAISFAIFSTIGFIFYNQNQNLSRRIADASSKLVNDIIVMDSIKSLSCKACDTMTIKENIPPKIGGFFYNLSLTQQGVTNQLLTTQISTNTTTFNLNETFTFSGSINSNNKKIEIQINNINNRCKLNER